MIYFEESVGDAIRDAIASDSKSDGMCLAYASQVIRRDIFKEYPNLRGSFTQDFFPKQCVSKS